MKSSEIYQTVTDRIVASLEEGNIPWHRPWKIEGGVHRSLATKKVYRGINQFWLSIIAQSEGYESSWWLTYKQAQKLGGQVRKGEKSTLVFFFKPIPIEEIVNGKKVKKTIPFLKSFNVFNASQCDGIETPKVDASEFTPIERAQAIIDQMPDAPDISFGHDIAAYSPSMDDVYLPNKKAFDLAESYYVTAYHELVHSTGHSSRLNRCPDYDASSTEAYAKEELVAELGASMLAGLAGIDHPTTIENTKAYIKGWISALEDDPRLVVHAASKAQQAADYIIGPEDEDE